MKKVKANSHEIWALFCRIVQIKDLARNVFHGSVLNDILEGSHFSLVFVDAIESLAQNLGLGEGEYQDAVNSFKQYFTEQKNGNAAFRASAKSLLTKKQFPETDGDAGKIMKGYGVSYKDLQDDVSRFVAQGTSPSIFDTANTADDKFKWDRRSNLVHYDNFDVP